MSTALTVYVYTPEPERLRRFYEAALGVQPADHGDWLPFELPGGGTFALHRAGDHPEHDPGRVHLSFAVDDIEAVVARFQAAGARVLRDMADEAFGKRAYVEDPDGRQIQLVQHELE